MTADTDFTPKPGEEVLARDPNEGPTYQTGNEGFDAEADADGEHPSEEDNDPDTGNEGSEESPGTGEDDEDDA